MSLSRGLSLLRHAKTACKPVSSNFQQVRHGGGSQGYSYRCGAYPPTKFQTYGAEGLMGFMWAWMIYHIITEPEHILGEFEYPDPKKWTDEELGIPPEVE